MVARLVRGVESGITFFLRMISALDLTIPWIGISRFGNCMNDAYGAYNMLNHQLGLGRHPSALDFSIEDAEALCKSQRLP
jgi:hypothetical protein